ncbi:MAG: hypothetical protein JNL74_12520, partial [Fibrobacteres bacterium]|nr:hypothetical protein [Fibrobacterota bacterium]
AAACIIRKPEILFQYSTNIPELYQQVKSVISYKDSFDLNPENLISFELKPHPKTYLRRLQQLKSVQLVPVVMNVKNDILTLADMELELSNLISAVSTGKNIASQVRTTYATLKDYNLNAEIDTVKAVVSDLRKFRAAPDLTRLKAQVNILKRGVSAVTALKDFKPQFSVQININVPGMECQLQDAILAFKEIKAALQKGYKPQCAKSYVKRLSAFFALLEVPKIEMPKLRFPGLDKIAIASPELFEEVINIFGITQYVTSIIEAASTIKNVYAEIKSMSEEIETLVAQFSGEAKDEGAMLQASLDYAISLGMMAFSFAKMLPKTIENSSSQAAALSTIGKKLAKALMKELWKEIESGGLLEVGFAEAMRSKSAPSASDAVMASMSVDSDSLKKLISAMPLNFADSALNQTKYRIVVTKGVITPTRDGSKALDFVAGGGGTEGMLRAQIQATMDKLVKQATEEVRKKITDEITKATVKLSDKMKNDIAESMKNGGKLKESLIKAGGSEEDYKKLTEIIQSVLSGVAETVGAQLADKLAAMGANAVVKVAEKLAKLEPVQKAWEKLAVLDAINPATVISIYNTVLKVADDDRGLPLIIAATYFSPLLKLGLYENGDFISSAKSQRGENCALFQSAKDVKRTVIDVDHPLAPFAGIAILGTGMDIAALLAPDPASKESIRITKIITVNLLSAGIAISKKEELQEYFVNSHNKAVHHLENKSNLDTQLFDTPSVSVKIPNAVKK